MTWGQLRLQLQTAAPGVSLDLIDGYLNARYETVLEAADWQGLKKHAPLQTAAAHQSVSPETVTFTVGSATVTGVNTGWTSAQIAATPKLYRPGDTVTYAATWVSATSLSLDRPYEGPTGTEAAGTVYTASAYVLMQNVYPAPANCRTVVSILDPVTGFPLNPMSKDELDASAGPRTLVANPVYYVPYDDSDESTPPVVREIELFPPPAHGRALNMQYVYQPLYFDGQSTNLSPLPWVSSTVLLEGCRAEIAAHLGNQLQVTYYEAKFTQELNRMLLLEHAQKRAKRPMQFASRFTRHRMARAARGYGRNWGIGQGGPY